MSDKETVSLKFDPKREQVTDVISAALNEQDPEFVEQSIADALMGTLIIGGGAGYRRRGRVPQDDPGGSPQCKTGSSEHGGAAIMNLFYMTIQMSPLIIVVAFFVYREWSDQWPTN